MPLVVAALLGLCAFGVVLAPLLGPDQAREEAGQPLPVAELADREHLARSALREVEFDHSLGNLDDADYQALRERYERRALAALKVRYLREQELDARIERELTELRARAEREPTTTALAAERSPASQTDVTSAGTARATTPSQAHNGPRARRRKGL